VSIRSAQGSIECRIDRQHFRNQQEPHRRSRSSSVGIATSAQSRRLIRRLRSSDLTICERLWVPVTLRSSGRRTVTRRFHAPDPWGNRLEFVEIESRTLPRSGRFAHAGKMPKASTASTSTLDGQQVRTVYCVVRGLLKPATKQSKRARLENRKQFGEIEPQVACSDSFDRHRVRVRAIGQEATPAWRTEEVDRLRDRCQRMNWVRTPVQRRHKRESS
jgi:hypothetical protein